MRKVWVLGLLVTACVTARFEQFDASFDPAPARQEPAWLDGGLLPSEYMMVGVIDIKHREATAAQVISDKARREGRGLGCALVMPEPPRDIEMGPDAPPVEPNRTRFICALPRPGGAPTEAMVP
ncbi:MAG: hypothetical protein IPJ65_29600 [Archangiaceae bacterium]|nr:hypothetical protein [Archangiaceae bacterium]